MFADDTSLTATGESSFEIEYKLEVEIQNVKTWLDANKLTLNEEKTEYNYANRLRKALKTHQKLPYY